MRRFTASFSSSLFIANYKANLSGLLLTLVRSTIMSVGTGSTDDRQVLINSQVNKDTD